MCSKRNNTVYRGTNHIEKKKIIILLNSRRRRKDFPIAPLENNLTLKNKRSVETKGLYTAQILTITTIITMTMMLYK